MITYTEKRTVEHNEGDFRRIMTLSSALDVIQNVSGINSTQLGIDGAVLATMQMGWVISKIRLNVKRLPAVDEQIICETWANPPKRFEYERCCRMTTLQGEELFSSRARWCIIRWSDGKPVPSTEVTYPQMPEFRTDSTMDKLPKLSKEGEWEKVFSQRIRLSLIDVNRHLNNAHYADFVMDCFSAEEYSQMNITEFQLDFLSQVREGEELCVSRVRDEYGWRIKGEVEGRLAFLAQIKTK